MGKDQVVVSLPITIHIEGETYRLNRNQFDNLHWRVRNKIKNSFFSYVRTWYINYLLRSDITLFPPLRLRYKLFMKSKRRVDPANIIDVVNKMFCDALTPESISFRKDKRKGQVVIATKPGLGIIQDDSHEYISREDDIEIGFDKENPRVEVTILSLGEDNADANHAG